MQMNLRWLRRIETEARDARLKCTGRLPTGILSELIEGSSRVADSIVDRLNRSRHRQLAFFNIPITEISMDLLSSSLLLLFLLLLLLRP